MEAPPPNRLDELQAQILSLRNLQQVSSRSAFRCRPAVNLGRGRPEVTSGSHPSQTRPSDSIPHHANPTPSDPGILNNQPESLQRRKHQNGASAATAHLTQEVQRLQDMVFQLRDIVISTSLEARTQSSSFTSGKRRALDRQVPAGTTATANTGMLPPSHNKEESLLQAERRRVKELEEQLHLAQTDLVEAHGMTLRVHLEREMMAGMGHVMQSHGMMSKQWEDLHGGVPVYTMTSSSSGSSAQETPAF